MLKKTKKSPSLKLRFFILLSIPLTIGFIVIGIFTFLQAKHEAEEVYDATLSRSAKILLSLIEHEAKEHKEKGIKFYKIENFTSHKYENKLAYRIWHEDVLITLSPNAKNFGEKTPVHGFQDKTINKEKWRLFVLYDEKSKIKVEVAEKYEVRNELIYDILFSTFTPLLLLIPIIAIVLMIAVVRGLKPLKEVSREVEKRTADNLNELILEDKPLEIIPLVDSINSLMDRLNKSLEVERHFTDNAAHELRTPLAAIKTTAQVALVCDDSEKEEVLEDLIKATDRASHLIDQLLTLTRIQNEEVVLGDINFSDAVKLKSAELTQKALEKDINLSADIEENVIITGNEGGIYILIRNIIHNAIKYTGRGKEVHISLKKENDKIVFSVTDEGRGISEEDKEQIFQRFFRGKGVRGEGTGLGLTMVKRVADQHGAIINLKDNPKGGLIFEVVF